MENKCIFCRIAAGEVACRKIYEDEKFLAFLDINPRRRGHSIVIPKLHVKTLLELPQESTGEYLEVIQAVARHITGALEAEGFNMGSNNGEAAGQVVPHLHTHIIPRFAGEKTKFGFEAAFSPEEHLKSEIESVHKKIGVLAPILRKTNKKEEEKQKEEKETKKEETEWDFDERSLLPRNY